MLKWHYSTVRSMKTVAVLTEDGAFALFSSPLFFSASFGLTSKNNNLQQLLNYFRLYKKNRLLL